MKNITREDIVNLRKEFNEFIETANPMLFPLILMADLNFDRVESLIESGEYIIEDNQYDLRSMFRCILHLMDKDFSEYMDDIGELIYSNATNNEVS